MFSIDNGNTFETVNTFLLPMPQKFKNIPPFALNIGLVGLQSSTITNSSVLIDFLKKQENYKIKVLFNISKKYFVECYNAKEDKCLNLLLNPKFQSVKK